MSDKAKFQLLLIDIRFFCIVLEFGNLFIGMPMYNVRQ